MIAWHGFVLLVLAAWLPACSCFTGQVFAPAGFLRPNLATSTRRPRTQKDENFKLCKIGPNVEGSWQSSTMSLASPASHALPGNIGYSWRLNVRPHHRHRSQLHAVSTPSAAELPSSERGLLELNRLLDLHEAELDVREAAGMDGDCVAQLRCIVFGQGKDMYRSQRQKMRTSPHYLLAGMYKTTLMVAVVRALTPRAQQVCKDVVLADMQELLDQAWISTWEHAQLVEQFEFEWQQRSELVVGSVDCSVHEMLDSSLTLRRWVYVSSMAVRSFVRKRGIGERLLVLAVAHARKIFGVKQMFLHVEELNAGALRLYQRAGFVPGDIDDLHTQSMDRVENRMLRLVLQVPPAATLYTRRLALDGHVRSDHLKHVEAGSVGVTAVGATAGSSAAGSASSAVSGTSSSGAGSTKMHHIAAALQSSAASSASSGAGSTKMHHIAAADIIAAGAAVGATASASSAASSASSAGSTKMHHIAAARVKDSTAPVSPSLGAHSNHSSLSNVSKRGALGITRQGGHKVAAPVSVVAQPELTP